MKRTSRMLLALGYLGACTHASAATLVEQRSAFEGDESQAFSAYFEGGDSRMGDPDAAQYMLMNWDKKTLYMVDVASRRATDMSAGLRESGPARKCPEPQVDAVLEHVGAGPKIAGYATEHYIVKADGKACEEIFTSRKAFDDQDWLERLREMDDRDDGDSGRSKCEIASDKVADPAEIGWPLRTVTLRGPGRGFHEVLRIEKNVSVPSGFFGVPAGYEIVTLEQMYPELAGAQGSGAMPQLPCPSPDEYEDYDDSDYGDGDGYFDDGDDEEEENYDEDAYYEDEPAAGDGYGEEDDPGSESIEDTAKDAVKGLFDGLKKGFGG